MEDKPGARALLAMKNLKDEVTEFKKPEIVITKKKKKKILNEDQYIQEMGKIIQRDFFPDLEKLVAQNEYLEAKEKNDIFKLRQLYEKYSHGSLTSSRRSRSGESPATFETPLINPNETPLPPSDTPRSTTSSKNSDRSDISIGDNHTLNSFLHNFTSEDNNSFQEIMEKAEEKLKQKFAILYNAEKMSAIEFEKKLVLPAIEHQFSIKNNGEIETWTYKNKNSIMYIPDGVDFTETEKLEFAKKRPAINHSNTRLNPNFQNKIVPNDPNLPNNRLIAEKVDIDGNIVKKPENPNSKYDFVRTPSPHPSEMGSPLMTWGEIEGTPFRLDAGDTPVCHIPGPSFRINATPRRETIALELAEKASERLRNQKQNAIEAARKNVASPYIKSIMDRKLAMSPAAKKLYASSKGKKTPGSGIFGGGINTNLLIRTPKTGLTPLIVRKATTTNIRKKNITTPKISNLNIQQKDKESSAGRPGSNKSSEDLTANLLNIPKRKTASDFF